MKARHDRLVGTLWTIPRINHGMNKGTSLPRDSAPTATIPAGRLWTCGQRFPQAGDSGDKTRLTRR